MYMVSQNPILNSNTNGYATALNPVSVNAGQQSLWSHPLRLGRNTLIYGNQVVPSNLFLPPTPPVSSTLGSILQAWVAGPTTHLLPRPPTLSLLSPATGYATIPSPLQDPIPHTLTNGTIFAAPVIPILILALNSSTTLSPIYNSFNIILLSSCLTAMKIYTTIHPLPSSAIPLALFLFTSLCIPKTTMTLTLFPAPLPLAPPRSITS